ncbi:beta-phosphoglucomutase [Salmonella enterica]|nr:beta-phosphoglucomutase [Salmonella enterica subsp. salamae]EEO2380753.1 beta-phosphoglucomutase [Salmonella enterica]ECI4076058.1 beta-phosphoglucomutase [Salmonella enterica subsp. salamae]EIC8289948.1 beta-phosphoglucomutase [Salmonella enterica]EJH2657732.1 beta-phosphoglucomutase [Salmonella enterica]
MKPQAIIFDLDGVITDTAHLHFMAWKQIADEMGIVIDEAFNDSLKGISRMASLRHILRHGGKEGRLSESECLHWASRKNAIYVNSLRQLTPHSVLPGIRELLNTLIGLQIPIALASVSLNAPAILQALDIVDFFDFCADASQITRSKPDPEIFITACKGLGVVPEKCIGIEDAQAGITAINACGMRSVGIGKSLTGAGLLLPSTEYLTWSCLSAFWLNA